MDNKELKKLSRRELIEIIYQMKRNEQKLQEENAALQTALKDKRIRLEKAGSIADAVASVSGLFTAAQSTVELYLNEIACMKADARRECAQMLEEARETAARIISEAQEDFTEDAYDMPPETM